MNKKQFALLLLMITPTVALGRDGCTNPTAYTIDRRCYVTDAQKQTTPYNAVVGLLKNNEIICSGTIIKRDGSVYIYTAAHCVRDKESDIAPERISIKLQDGTIVNVKRYDIGNYSWVAEENKDYLNINFEGDWAIYALDGDTTNTPFVQITDGQGFVQDSARTIGYGILKIMSDNDIKNFKNKYISALIENGAPKEKIGSNVGLEKYGGVDIDVPLANAFVEDYLFNKESGYYQEFFSDRVLKESVCRYGRDGTAMGCQSWKGDSGGGIFDEDGDLMGIITRGRKVIGGENHAETGFEIGSVNYQPTPTWFETHTDKVVNFFK